LFCFSVAPPSPAPFDPPPFLIFSFSGPSLGLSFQLFPLIPHLLLLALSGQAFLAFPAIFTWQWFFSFNPLFSIFCWEVFLLCPLAANSRVPFATLPSVITPHPRFHSGVLKTFQCLPNNIKRVVPGPPLSPGRGLSAPRFFSLLSLFFPPFVAVNWGQAYPPSSTVSTSPQHFLGPLFSLFSRRPSMEIFFLGALGSKLWCFFMISGFPFSSHKRFF